MRLCLVVSVLALAVVGAACRGGVGYRGLTVEVKVPARVRVDVDAAAAARARVGGEVRAGVEAEAAVAVPVEGAPVAEFFGIPLEGASDVVFVLDRSGSMTEPALGQAAGLRDDDAVADAGPALADVDGGPPGVQVEPVPPPSPQKIEVARRELVAALRRVEAGTRLNVIFFNAQVDGFRPGVVPIDGASREELIHFVEETPAEGQTALSAALRTAFLMNPRRVVLLSDGLGNLGDGAGAILRDAREAMRGGVRIDTVGLGLNQDDALLRALAAESGGLYQAF